MLVLQRQWLGMYLILYDFAFTMVCSYWCCNMASITGLVLTNLVWRGYLAANHLRTDQED